MTQLTPSQKTLLQDAAGADDGVVEAKSATAATAKSLVRRGLLISIRRPEGGSHLQITTEGRGAIGESPPVSPPTREGPKGKVATIIELLRRPEGATVQALMDATGWQAHSVRGAIAGAIKKDRKLPVTSEKTDAGRTYRIAEGAGA